MTPAEYLAGLPEPIQAELVTIAREAIGMSDREKTAAMAMFAALGIQCAFGPHDEAVPGGRMAAALGLILRLAHDKANPGATNGY